MRESGTDQHTSICKFNETENALVYQKFCAKKYKTQQLWYDKMWQVDWQAASLVYGTCCKYNINMICWRQQ